MMLKRQFETIAAIAVVTLMAVAPAMADEITFAIDNNAWDGHANLGVYAPGSGAVIDYEIFVSITDAELDGYDAQGLAGFDGDLITNTGITQPLLDFAPTNEGTTYIYTIVDNTWYGSVMSNWRAGFGFGYLESNGNNQSDIGVVLGAGAFMSPEYRGVFAAPRFQPSSQWGVGYDTPASGDRPRRFEPGYGFARAKWYMLRGQTIVPDAPGDYTVEFMPNSALVIRNDVDLNNEIDTGYVEDGFLGNTVTSTGFSFTVTPEPATAGLLLSGFALALHRRKRK